MKIVLGYLSKLIILTWYNYRLLRAFSISIFGVVGLINVEDIFINSNQTWGKFLDPSGVVWDENLIKKSLQDNLKI